MLDDIFKRLHVKTLFLGSKVRMLLIYRFSIDVNRNLVMFKHLIV